MPVGFENSDGAHAMHHIHLSAVCEQDLDEIFAFELENRAFFESWINARPGDFYTLDGVRKSIQDAIREAAADNGYQYMVRDIAGRVIGRVNLHRVRRQHFHSAELGYRISREASGKRRASR